MLQIITFKSVFVKAFFENIYKYLRNLSFSLVGCSIEYYVLLFLMVEKCIIFPMITNYYINKCVCQ